MLPNRKSTYQGCRQIRHCRHPQIFLTLSVADIRGIYVNSNLETPENIELSLLEHMIFGQALYHRISLNVTFARASVYFSPLISTNFVGTITSLSLTFPVTRSWQVRHKSRAHLDSKRRSPVLP